MPARFPGAGNVRYNLACLEASTVAPTPRSTISLRRWRRVRSARKDEDLVSLRGTPRFTELTGAD